MTASLVIIGGGPAGMAAAIEAAKAGLACTLLDEAPRLGGQVYRQPPREFRLTQHQTRDRDYRRGAALRNELAAVGDRIDVRSETAVVGLEGAHEVVWASRGAAGTLRAEQLVIAAGAYERPMPFPGWTLPGVMTAGGAQSLVKTLHVQPGRRALVAGTGPLLLVAANQLHSAGVEVVAVLEAGRPIWSPGVLPKIWGEWQLLHDAWTYWRGLRRARIPVHFNHTVFEAHGRDEVEAVSFGPIDPASWRPLAQAQRVDVDLVVVGFGLVPNTALTELAGCRHDYVHEVGGWIPVRSAHMETTVSGVFAVGDGAGVAGALVAIQEGRIAGITAAERAGELSATEADRRRAPALQRLRSLARVRSLLDEMSCLRPGLSELATPATLACRCEEVSIAEVDSALQQGAQDLQAVKLLTRLGMGPCQGRNCGPSMAMHLAHRLGRAPADTGRINPRPPLKPVTLGAMARLNASATTDADLAAPAHGDLG